MKNRARRHHTTGGDPISDPSPSLSSRIHALTNAVAQSEAQLRSVIENMPVVLDAFDAKGLIVVWNREAERVTGYAATEIIGNPRAMERLYPDAAYREQMMTEWARRGNDYRDWEWELTAKDGSRKILSWSSHSDRFPIPGWATWGLAIDLTERHRSAAFQREQREILEAVARGEAPLRELFERLTRLAESHSRGMIASVQLVDEAGKHLRHVVAPNLPDEYNRVVDGLAIEEGAGSCGTAASRAERVIVDDTFADPLWAPYRDVAERFGLRACWSQPICAGDHRVLGTFALYHKEPHIPTESELRLMEGCAHIAAVAVERSRAAESLRRQVEHTQQLLATTLDGYILADTQGRILDVNPAYCDMVGYDRETLLEMNLRQLEARLTSAEVEEKIATMLAAGSACFETEHRHRDGHKITLGVSISILSTPEPAVAAFVRDVTAERSARAALQASEEKYRRLVTLAHDAVLLADVESGVIVDANQAAETLLGLEREQILGLPQASLHPPEEAERYLRIFAEHVRRGSGFASDLEICRSDGTRVPVEISASVIDIGQRRFLQGILRDLSDRRRAEKALQRVNRALRTRTACIRELIHASEEHALLRAICRTLIDTGGYALAWVGLAPDRSARTIDLAAAAGPDQTMIETIEGSLRAGDPSDEPVLRTICNGTREIMQDLRLESPDTPLWRAALDAGHDAAIALPLSAQGEDLRAALVLHSLEAHAFDEEEVTLLADLADDVAYGITTLRARERRHAAEAELRKLSVAIQQNPAVVIITDSEGRIEYVNPRFTEVTGYTMQESLGRNPRFLKFGDKKREDYQELWSTISAGRTWHGEFRNIRKNGQAYWERALIAPVRDEDGAISHYLAMKEDITEAKHLSEERHHLEAQLRHAQKMETIGTLAGGIAHDFNNLLQAIIGYGELALQDTSSRSAAHRDVEQILSAAQRAKDLSRQILTFSRQVETEHRQVLLGPIAREAIKLLRASLPSTIEIHEQIDPDLSPVIGDAVQIHQVVMNLCTNAFHAMHDGGGRLAVRLEEVDVDLPLQRRAPRLEPGRHLRLSVTDTGTGMTPEMIERIFDPFYTTRAAFGGTGLGLSVVHGIVTDHGGAVLVDSSPHEGSSFSVYLPVAAESPTQGNDDSNSSGLGCEKILYVDDNLEVVHVIERTLTRLGYSVTPASCAAEAIDLLRADPGAFDVLITDQVMPGKTGVELSRATHELRPELPVILVSGYLESVEPEELAAAGIREHLIKPLIASEVGRAIRRALSAGRTEGA